MTEPVAILSYANPRGGQPVGSAFDVELLPTGIALRRQLLPEPYEAVAVALVAGMVAALVALCTWGAVTGRHHDWSNRLMAGFAVVLAFVAVELLAYARRVWRPREQAIVLEHGRLTVTNGAWSTGARQPFTARPRAFVVAASEVHLVQRRARYTVSCRGRWGRRRSILTGLSKDECAWVVGTLNASLHATDLGGDRTV